MAIIHQATLTPTKLELLSSWLPGHPWFSGAGTGLERVGTFRFDDPAGEVGIETLLVGEGDSLWQVPLTYRSAPLAGAALVGMMAHSVLGERYVYDAPTDPVYVAELVRVMATGGRQATEFVQDGDAPPVERTGGVQVRGSGQGGTGVPVFEPTGVTTDTRATVISAGSQRIILPRVLDGDWPRPEGISLRASWGDNSAELAWLG